MLLIFIFLLALLPSLLYLAVFRRAKQRFQVRMRRIQTRTVYLHSLPEEELYGTSRRAGNILEHPHDFIGNINCRFNAHSPYLRCAVNPSGPCEDCVYYDSNK